MSQNAQAQPASDGIARNTRLAFELVVFVVFCYATWQTASMPYLAAVFPRTVAAIGAVLSALTIVVDLARVRAGKPIIPTNLLDAPTTRGESHAGKRASFLSGLRYPLWFIAYPVGIAIINHTVVTLVFILLFLRFEGKVKWHWSALVAVIATITVVLVSGTMKMAWPVPLWDFG